jgi:hypothetical protein
MLSSEMYNQRATLSVVTLEKAKVVVSTFPGVGSVVESEHPGRAMRHAARADRVSRVGDLHASKESGDDGKW